MQIADEDVHELKEILKDDYGVDLATQVVHDIGVSLVNLVDVFFRENSTHSLGKSNI